MALNQKQRDTLERATALYQADVAQIQDYLKGRGIDGATAKQFRLGYVAHPIIGHEAYAGRLAIPYITPTGVVDIRFRCVELHNCKELGHAKYMSQPGHEARLFGTTAVMTADNVIAITEGELDAVILNKIGIPAVGIGGAQAWHKKANVYHRVFADFEEVYIFGDGDEAGRSFSKQLAKELDNATVISMPTGMDVTDLYLAEGADGLLYRAGLISLETETDEAIIAQLEETF